MDAVTAETPNPAQYPALTVPADGIPQVVTTPQALADAKAALVGGSGPIALDTERAHGYRYSAKAYLIQLRRDGAGTHLIDPVAFEEGNPRADFHELADELADSDWILHAASQDLPCLAELQLLPKKLFDSELAGRLLNLPKVSLSALMEHALGITLLKKHSAADWSRRPIPEDWLAYAALDVERLIDLREWLIEQLTLAEKLEWASQEFAHLAAHAGDPAVSRREPWRRTSGLHAIHAPVALGVVRELWLARETLAKDLDYSPSRLLPDRAITDLATAMVADGKSRLARSDLRRVRAFGNRLTSRHEASWVAALDRAAALDKAELPARAQSLDGPPQPRSWERRWPSSYERYFRVRPALAEVAEELNVPPENLLAPDNLRRLLWDSPDATEPSVIEAQLQELGARQWQREHVVSVIAQNW